MKFRIGFKNGMIITVEAQSIFAAGHNDIRFIKGEKLDQQDADFHVSASEVLFFAPEDKSHVERGAVDPFVPK